VGLRQVRAELAELISTATGLTCLDHVPITPITPSAFVGFDGIDLVNNRTANGNASFELPVTFVVGLADPVAAQHSLDAYLTAAAPDAIADHTGVSWASATAVRTNPPVLTDDDRLTVDLIVSIRAQL
jgi:hypothetical protein